MPYYQEATGVPANTITDDKLADMPEARVKGRAVGAGVGDPQNLTGPQIVEIIGPLIGPPSGPAGGDLTGTYPNPALIAITGGGTFGDAATIPRVTVDNKGRVVNIVAVPLTSLPVTPAGPAGGDLTGTYPNPTLALNRVKLAGDTMSGPLVLPADPTAALQAATKQYVDGKIAAGPVGPAGGVLYGSYPNPSGLSDNSVFSSTIVNGAVTGAKIPGSNITNAHIADGSISTPKIVDGAVTSAKIADGTIVGGDIATNTITGAHIQANTITGAHVQANTITSANIQDGSITGGDIAINSVGMDRLPDILAGSFIGRWKDAGTGDPTYLTNYETLLTLGVNTGAIAWLHRPSWNSTDTGGNWMATSAPNLGQMVIYNPGGMASIAYHNGNYAAYMGLDGDNLWKVGGWSMGSVSCPIFHSGYIANKAQMEAGSGIAPVTASYARNHPGTAKVWGIADANAGLYLAYAISSMSDGGVGVMGFNYSFALNGAYHPSLSSAYTQSFSPCMRTHFVATNSVTLVCTNSVNSVQTDPILFNFAAFGTDP